MLTAFQKIGKNTHGRLELLTSIQHLGDLKQEISSFVGILVFMSSLKFHAQLRCMKALIHFFENSILRWPIVYFFSADINKLWK